MKNILLHIPHSSKFIPKNNDLLTSLEASQEIEETLLKLTDSFTNELFDWKNAEQIVFPYSRIYCDVERYLDAEKEPMSQKGMGVKYTKGINGIAIRNTGSVDQDEQLKKVYYNHHNQVRNLIGERNKSNIKPLLIDCHSFSNERFKNDGVNINDLILFPDFCIGYNLNDISSEKIAKKIALFLKKRGYIVFMNSPYNGSLAYDDLNHHSVMIEINKNLYLREDYLTKKTDFYKVKNTITILLNHLQHSV